MKTFECTRLRLCNYLMDRGFFPYRAEPDSSNPHYQVYLFEDTPALTAAVARYVAVDCYTAKKKNTERKSYYDYERTSNDPSTPNRPADGAEDL